MFERHESNKGKIETQQFELKRKVRRIFKNDSILIIKLQRIGKELNFEAI